MNSTAEGRKEELPNGLLPDSFLIAHLTSNDVLLGLAIPAAAWQAFPV